MIELPRNLRDIGSFPVADRSPGSPEPNGDVLTEQARPLELITIDGGCGEGQQLRRLTSVSGPDGTLFVRDRWAVPSSVCGGGITTATGSQQRHEHRRHDGR